MLDIPQMQGAPPPVAEVVDTSRVESWILERLNRAKSNAEAVSKTYLWERVEAENKAYGLRDTVLEPQDAGIKAASLGQHYEVRTKDLADQVDEMTALLLDLLDSGELWRLVPKAGVTQLQAELTQKVQNSLLDEKDWRGERRKFVGRFVRNCFSGLKVCRSHEISYITDRVEVPLRRQEPVIDPYTGMPMLNMGGQPVTSVVEMYTDGALMERGFSYDKISDGSALRSALAEDGLLFVGIADMREDGTYENLLCTQCRETTQDFVYLKAVNPRRIAIADPTRPCKEQPSIHEFHYLTENELRKAHFRNVDELSEKGTQIRSTAQQNPGNVTSTTQAQSTLIDPVYEIAESWLEIPWEQGVIDGAFGEDELRAFAIEQGFPVEELQYRSSKWCGFHNKGNLLLGIQPSYLIDKSDHPFRVESFVYGDGEFAGNSQMERLANVAANMLAFLNMTARGIKKNLYQSRIVSDRLQLSDEALNQLDQYGGFARVEGNVTDIDGEIKTLQVPDISGIGMNMVQYFEEKLRGLGVPSILAGEGQADTATQDTINNRRGQTIVNEAFGRMMNVFVASCSQHLGVMVNTFTESRYIEIVGEDGATMTRRWTMPREITDKLEIVPMVSFNEGEKQRMIQFLLGLMNVVAPALGPPSVKALLKLAMEKFGIDSSDIAKIEGTAGSTTSVQQELQSMFQDPDSQVEVRMEDPHQVCIQMAYAALEMDKMRYEQEGMPQPDRANVMEYIQLHEGMMQQQQMMQMMQQMQEQGPQPPMQGKPVQGRADGGPGTEQGDARQMGQAVGVGNQGPMSAAGLTGQGSVGLVKGAPAGV